MPAATVPLITVYEHDDWRGRSDTLVGDWGPCDAAGYRFTSLVLATNFTSLCRLEFGNVRYIGETCNHHLWSMRVYKYYA